MCVGTFHYFHRLSCLLCRSRFPLLKIFHFTKILQEHLTVTTCERASGFSSCGLPMCQTVCMHVLCLCQFLSMCGQRGSVSDYSRVAAARVPHRRLARPRFCRRHLSAITLRLLTTNSFHTAIISTQYLAPLAQTSRPCNKETTDL